MNKLDVVIDTNVLLVSISSKSHYFWIYKALLEGEFNLLLSNEILNEYEEVISLKYNVSVAHDVKCALLLLPNVIKTEIYYNWRLITSDLDDNKFVDCAVAGNADYLVTHDRHFNPVKKIKFPHIQIINADVFNSVMN